MYSISARYSLDESDNVWAPSISTPFEYTDGEEFEQRLSEILRRAEDLGTGSVELRRAITDWPSRYHLSPTRANLLRPFAEILAGRVLEVGSGCGALTRFLGELNGTIVGLEGNRTRAAIAAMRCKGLSNVSIVCDRLESFESDAAFDAVTLVGVLEYARVFGSGDDPVRELLRRCRQHLAKDGRLILAVENQLGLKYFAGANEDHALLPMHGINDTYDEKSVVTFGRRELELILRSCGFEDIQFCAPLPDYKLPNQVVLTTGLSGRTAGFEPGDMFSQSAFSDPNSPRSPVFSLERAWGVVARNELLLDLANSFLIVASTEKQDAPLGTGNRKVLARHYSAERRPEFCKECVFKKSGAGIKVVRERLYDKAPRDNWPISMTLETSEYIPGEVWSERLPRVLNRPGWTASDVTAWAEPWGSLLRGSARGSDLGASLPKNYVDATPFNLIRDQTGAFHFFDLEWTTVADPLLGHVLFRGLFWTALKCTSVSPPADPEDAKLKRLIVTVLEGLGFWVTDEDLNRFVQLENKIGEWTRGDGAMLSLASLENARLGVRPPAAPDAGESIELKAQIGVLAEELRAERVLEESAAADLKQLHERVLDERHAYESRIANVQEQFEASLAETERATARARAIDLQLVPLQAELQEARERLQEERRTAEARILKLFQDLEAAAYKIGASDARADWLDQSLQRTQTELRETLELLVVDRKAHEVQSSNLRLKIDSVSSELIDATARAAALDLDLRQVRTELGETTERMLAGIHAHESLVDTLRADLASERNRAAFSEARAAALDTDLRQTQHNLQAERRQYEDRIAAVLREVESVTSNLAAANARTAGQALHLQRVQSELKALEQAYHADVRGLRERLARAEHEAAAQRQSGVDAAAKLAETERRVELERGEARRLREEVARLGLAADRATEVSERERRGHEAVRNSLTWRLTYPFRLAASFPIGLHTMFIRALFASPALFRVGKTLAKAVYAWGLPGGGLLLPRTLLFSGEFYAKSNPDTNPKRDLLAHYIAFGADEGRDPHPMFDSSSYLETNPDVASSGLNPLLHFIFHGVKELRSPHPGFDPSRYLSLRPDVEQSGMNALLQYWEHGRGEGAIATPILGPQANERVAAKSNGSHSRGVEESRASTSASVKVSVVADVAAIPTASGPLISILMPTFNTAPEVLRAALESVRRQSYPHWQLCIYDDGSSRAETHSVLEQYERIGDPRIVVRRGSCNQGIARASNAALALAEGQFTGMLDHDDELEPDALEEVARLFTADPSLDVVYTDQDYVDVEGRRIGTLFKPDWSPEMFRGVMFVNHILVVRTGLMRRIGGFDPSFDRIQDFEFMLRVSEATSKIGHARRSLYHWRSIPGSVAAGANSKGLLEPLQAAAVNAHMARRGIRAVARPHPKHSHRLTIHPVDRTNFPRVLVAVRNSTGLSESKTVSSILELSTYRNLIVQAPPELANGIPADKRLRTGSLEAIHRELGPADFLVWVESGMEVASADWLETLLMYCEQPDVACVSPLIVQEDDSVWCAGLVLGMDGGLGYTMRGWPRDADGYAGSLSCAREVSSVSGECMMISGRVYQQVGGSVKYYGCSTFDGADLSLRATTIRYRNIVTPQALVRRRGPESRLPEWKLDEALFADRWRELLAQADPFYNPNFSQRAPGYEIEPEVVGISA